MTTCPSCGEELSAKKSLRFSLIDFLGVTFVGAFLIGVLALIIYGLGPWKTVVGFAIILVVALMLRYGADWREILKPRIGAANILNPGGLIGGVLFLLWALVRFFFRFEVHTTLTCNHCGYKSGEKNS